MEDSSAWVDEESSTLPGRGGGGGGGTSVVGGVGGGGGGARYGYDPASIVLFVSDRTVRPSRAQRSSRSGLADGTLLQRLLVFSPTPPQQLPDK